MAVELAHLGPWKYDPKTNLFEFGDEFYAIYGTDVAREGAFMVPDVYAGEFVHPDDVWVVGAEVHKVLSFTERCYSRESLSYIGQRRCRHLSGRRRHGRGDL
ncbi:MAG: hypothetical protein VR69_05385 [Peptococcaceae bacterium BRH_c4b]|nr:MAG: hypothetical protein VR69_05385 [Peptococcaceae bacterium BRH_c4b]